MAASWTMKDAPVSRPDPYLEWQALRRREGPEPRPDRWCFVLRGRDDERNVATSDPTIPGVSDVSREDFVHQNVIASDNEKQPEYRSESEIYGKDGSEDIAFASPPLEHTKEGVDRRLLDWQKVEDVAKDFYEREEKPPAGTVLMAVIDHRIAYAHERFRYRDHKKNRWRSRVEAIWLQAAGDDILDGETGTKGAVLTAAKIEEHMLDGVDDASVYRKAVNTGEIPPSLFADTHGTHVTDVACGFDPDDPEGRRRPILAVQLPSAVVGDTSGFQMVSYAIEALWAIFKWADALGPGLPLVVNFSFGFSAGSKDGSHPLEKEMDRLITARRLAGGRTFIVLPSGNNYESRDSARIELAKGENEHIDWHISPDDRTPSYLEIYCNATTGLKNATTGLKIGIESPGGGKPLAVSSPLPNTTHLLEQVYGKPIAMLHVTRASNQARGVRIVLVVAPTAGFEPDDAYGPAGTWRLTFENSAQQSRVLDLFVQRDDDLARIGRGGRQSVLDHPSSYSDEPTLRDASGKDRARHLQSGSAGAFSARRADYNARKGTVRPFRTLSAIATGAETIVVGAALERESEPALPARYSAGGTEPGAKSGKGKRDVDFSGIVGRNLEGAPYVAGRTKRGARHLSKETMGGLIAAGANSGSTVAYHGTSVAAPIVARALADNIGDVVGGSIGQQFDPLPKPPGGALPADHTKYRLGRQSLKDRRR